MPGTRSKLCRLGMEQYLFLEVIGESTGYCVSEFVTVLGD
jgi:hypothetical protein